MLRINTPKLKSIEENASVADPVTEVKEESTAEVGTEVVPEPPAATEVKDAVAVPVKAASLWRRFVTCFFKAS